MGENSAISLLSWPPTNSVLAEKVRYVKPRITDKRIPLNYTKEQLIQNKKQLKGILKKTQKVILPKVIPKIEDFKVGTSSKNNYYKPKADTLYEKMKTYLNHCNRIKKAYKEKHREIKRIFDFVKKLQENQPDIPIKNANIKEVIQYLENNIKIEDIENKNIELDKKIRQQNIWKAENENIYKELIAKFKLMKK
jgi:hypothetical protein